MAPAKATIVETRGMRNFQKSGEAQKLVVVLTGMISEFSGVVVDIFDSDFPSKHHLSSDLDEIIINSTSYPYVNREC